MAVYIDIKKKETKDAEVVYSYAIEALSPGLLSLNTKNGEVSQLKKIESDNDEMLFARAVHKVKKLSIKENYQTF